ncbi:MAG: hypothetical protein JO112_17235, partial [Planctomycetes bacterium]|nr:hypothetical protein [Planctomycetota bacterium]
MKQSRSLVKASSRSSGVPGGRRLAGLLLLAAGVAASLVLVWQHLQGRGDPAWDGSRVGSWEGSIGGWPHSFLSLAYFIGLAAAWFPSSKGKVPASFRYLVRLGGLASAGLLLLVFLGGGEQWGWLLAAHGANLVF